MGLEKYFNYTSGPKKNPLMEAHRTEAVSRLRRDAVTFDPLTIVTVTLFANHEKIGEVSERGAWWPKQLDAAAFKSATNPLLNQDFDTYEVH